MSETKTKPIGQEEYENDFSFKSEDDNKSKQSQALERALDIRKFEIELYWKRSAYFWTFIGAALASYAVIQRIQDDSEKLFLSVLVSTLGLVFSFAWYCVNRGSKYWQENWENHVDLLETNVIGPLYKTVIARPDGSDPLLKRLLVGPEKFSVSKINQLVSVFVTIIWGLLVFKAIVSTVSTICMGVVIPGIFGLILIAFSLVTCLAICKFARTEDFNHEHLSARKRSSQIEISN